MTAHVQKVYKGQWGEYAIPLDTLSIQQKINRINELDELCAGFKSKQRGRWKWIMLPFLAVIFMAFYIGIENIPAQIVVTGLMSLLMYKLYISPYREKKFSWGKWIGILAILLSVPFLPSFTTDQTTASVVVVFVGCFIVAILYISLSHQGYGELMDEAMAEKAYLGREVTNGILYAPLEAETLSYGIVLGKDEIPLLEADAVLMEVQEYGPAPVGDGQPGYNTTYKNSVFQDVDFANKPFDQNINTFVNNVVSKATNLSKQIQPPQTSTRRYVVNSQNKNDFTGKLILTQKRILFVGCSRGFQIFLKDLVYYGTNPSRKGVITFQSKRSMRILACKMDNWYKLYIDRLSKEIA